MASEVAVALVAGLGGVVVSQLAETFREGLRGRRERSMADQARQDERLRQIEDDLSMLKLQVTAQDVLERERRRGLDGG